MLRCTTQQWRTHPLTMRSYLGWLMTQLLIISSKLRMPDCFRTSWRKRLRMFCLQKGSTHSMCLKVTLVLFISLLSLKSSWPTEELLWTALLLKKTSSLCERLGETTRIVWLRQKCNRTPLTKQQWEGPQTFLKATTNTLLCRTQSASRYYTT